MLVQRVSQSRKSGVSSMTIACKFARGERGSGANRAPGRLDSTHTGAGPSANASRAAPKMAASDRAPERRWNLSSHGGQRRCPGCTTGRKPVVVVALIVDHDGGSAEVYPPR